MSRPRLILLTALALSLVGPACASSPSVENFVPPKSPRNPPWGLDSVVVPDDKESLRIIFYAFPSAISGVGKCFDCGYRDCVLSIPQVCYGDATGLASFTERASITVGRAGEWIWGDFSTGPMPGRTVEAYFRERFDKSVGVEPGALIDWGGYLQRSTVDAIDRDPADGLLWIAFTEEPPDKTLWFVFGASSSKHIFTIESPPDPDMRDDLVKALVHMLRTYSGTPAA